VLLIVLETQVIDHLGKAKWKPNFPPITLNSLQGIVMSGFGQVSSNTRLASPVTDVLRPELKKADIL